MCSCRKIHRGGAADAETAPRTIAAHGGTKQVKSDYWNVTDEQLIEKTGQPLAHWLKVLKKFDAAKKKSNEVVAYLQDEHGVPRYWARTLTTRYLKDRV